VVRITKGPRVAPSRAEEPIRAEIFGPERLEQHAESLAAADRVTEKLTRGQDLLPRVRDNGRALLDSYHSTVEAAGAKREITLAEEWFLDNFHVVDEQLREIQDHLPKAYYRRLPKIAAGHLAGTPRVYGLAWAYVAHTDSHFELQTLERFVRAYQRVEPLGIGELWALPIHLRMVLVENLRRLSQQVTDSRQARAQADELADRLLGLSRRPAENLEEVLHPLDNAPLTRAFAVQLVQRLRDQEALITPALEWLNRRLAAEGTSPGEVVAQEHHAQGAATATVRNIISSMRWMSSIDWLVFFEKVSLVDDVLRGAPAFEAMDFSTRDEYRKQVELLSRGSKSSEIEVARAAVLLARNATESGASANQSQLPGIPERAEEDPGFYLVAKGRRDFERQLGFRIAFPCFFAFRACCEGTRSQDIWEGSRLLPRCNCAASCSSVGSLVLGSGAPFPWSSLVWYPPRRSGCPSSIGWLRFCSHPRRSRS
jgi:cyclic beta-1,2-glucan synthetase